MEAWLTERYCSSKVTVAQALLQRVLDVYVEALLVRERLRRPVSARSVGDGGTPLAERAQALMACHYDLPLELFQSFLGPSMKYSMALWEDAGSLDEAQVRMLSDVCEKARIEDGHAILDLGCGFGSLAEHVLERYPHATVVGLNLSKVQCEFLRARQSRSGDVLASSRFHLLEEDFNTAAFGRRFDRVVSLGFFEHVADLAGALARVETLLEPDGRCFLHFIVRHHARAGAGGLPLHGFIGRQIFPGGRIHPYDALPRACAALGVEREWFIDGSHYRRTLEAWLCSFRRSRERLERDGVVDAATLKRWELYLMACRSVFRAGGGDAYGNGQYLLRGGQEWIPRDRA